jgi:hypothetical protein
MNKNKKLQKKTKFLFDPRRILLLPRIRHALVPMLIRLGDHHLASIMLSHPAYCRVHAPDDGDMPTGVYPEDGIIQEDKVEPNGPQMVGST